MIEPRAGVSAPFSVITTLAGTCTHQTAVALFQRHHDAGTGYCTCCGLPAPCPAQGAAAAVCLAAGDQLAGLLRPGPSAHRR
jgi:hypothetical protein